MNPNNKPTIIYGLGGPEKAYTVISYYCIYADELLSYGATTAIMRIARNMKAWNPSIKRVYAIDNRRGLKKDYMDSMRVDSVESHAIFKDILEREGMLLNV